jgi:hypothetical protein
MRLSLAAAVSNDTLAEATATGVLCLLLLGTRHGFSTRLAIGIGAALAAAILAKASNLLLAPIVFAGIAIASQAKPDTRESANPKRAPAPRLDVGALARNAGLAAAAMVVVCGWWFARNQVLYHDFLMERTFQIKFAGALSARDAAQGFGCPDMGSYLTGLVLPTTFQTFWGAFGHLTPKSFMGTFPPHSLDGLPEALGLILGPLTFGALPPRHPIAYPPPSWIYPLLALWTWAVLIGLARAYYRGRRGFGREAWITGLLLGTYTLLVFASFLRFNLEYFQAQGRYLFPALAPIALAFATGWLHWFSVRRERWGAATLAALMLALAGYALFGVVVPGFG